MNRLTIVVGWVVMLALSALCMRHAGAQHREGGEATYRVFVCMLEGAKHPTYSGSPCEFGLREIPVQYLNGNEVIVLTAGERKAWAARVAAANQPGRVEDTKPRGPKP